MVLPMHEKIQRFVYTFFYLTPLLLTLISCQSEQIPELNLPTPPRGVVVPKEMVYIPEGEFIMGHPDHNKTVRGKKVYTHAYLIDKFEVTNEQYKKFDSTYRYPEGENNYPATYISYNMAVLYLNFVGKRLPIEAEWEKAARGTDGRMFPWGDKVFGPPNYGFSGLVTEPVGKRKALVSPFGAYDMVGNVWEWTSDWYSFEGMPKEYKKKFKVIRGGVLSVHLRSDYSYTFDRNYMPSDSKFNFIGFRGAKSIKSQ